VRLFTAHQPIRQVSTPPFSVQTGALVIPTRIDDMKLIFTSKLMKTLLKNLGKEVVFRVVTVDISRVTGFLYCKPIKY
jgi:hypothetical protein